MVTIVQNREKVTRVCHELCFEYLEEPPGRGGFSFKCDEDGYVSVADLVCDEARKNFNACSNGKVEGKWIRAVGVKRYEHAYWQPAIIECEVCQAHITLETEPTACQCGADYNCWGQRLSDRVFWGEETGETLVDIMGPETRE